MKLFDSTILIEHLRGESRATQALLSVPRPERLVSVLSRVEVEGGMRSGEREEVRALFGVVRMVPVTDPMARRAAAHLRRYRRSHNAIDVVDYVLAATTEQLGARLQTLNVRHFPMFGDLRPPW